MALPPSKLASKPKNKAKLNRLSAAIGGTVFDRQKGVSLIELLLAAGVVAAGTAVVFGVYTTVQANQKEAEAQNGVQHVLQNLISTYQASPNYTMVTTEGAIADGVFPSDWMGVDGNPVSPWGGAIRVRGTTRDGRPEGTSLVISLEDIPERRCASTVSALASGFSDVTINGTSIGGGSEMEVGQIGSLCNGRPQSTLQLFWDDRAKSGEGMERCTAGLTTETRNSLCPPGQLGDLVETRQVGCFSSYGPPSSTPWTEVSNTCAPECIAPAPDTQSRAATCPTGMTGEIRQERTQTWSCPAPTGNATPSDWSDWTEVSNTCAITCVAPSPVSRDRELECPTGQLGAITQRETTTWTCAGPTGNPTSTVSPWTQISNTCAPQCLAPSPTVTTQTQTATCPAGQATAQGGNSFEQTQTTTQTFVCSAPTGEPTPSSPVVSPWSPTVVATCAPLCQAPAPSTQTRTQACPAGQEGAITESQTVAFSCRSVTGQPLPMESPWVITSNTCRTPCTLPTPSTQTNTETRTAQQSLAECGANRYGTITQERSETRSQTRNASCPAGSSSPVWSAWSGWTAWTGTSNWSTTSSSCVNCPSPTTDVSYQWVARSGACPSGQLGSRTWEQQQVRSRVGSYKCPSGTPTLPPVSWGPYTAWADTSSTRNQVNTCAPVCVAPPPERRELPYTASCPAGWVGTYANWYTYETRSWSCPNQTGSPVATPWTWDGTSGLFRDYGNCTVCPGPQTETRSAACPTFQTGSITQQRTRNYNCSGTGSWGAWGAWTTTSSSCAIPACNGTLEGNARNYMAQPGNEDLIMAFYGTHPVVNWSQNYVHVYEHWRYNGYYEGRRQVCWPAP